MWNRNKFRAIRTEIDGISFASKKEAKRYVELKLLEKNKQIFDLELQPKFPMIINGIKVCNYIADFKYKKIVAGKLTLVIEDTKGVKTDVFKLKAKLFKACYPELTLTIS